MTRRLLSLMVVLLGMGPMVLNAQTTIAQQDFETAPAAPVWSIAAGAANISTATGAGDVPANQRIRNGSRSWQVNNGNATLDLGSVSTVGFTGIQAIVRISSTATNAGNGADLPDLLRVFTALNGGAFPASADITVSGDPPGNARWGNNNAQNTTTTAGTPLSVTGTSGTNQGTIHSTLIVNIPNGTSSVALRITALNNSNQEIWNVDDITLTGTASATLSATPLADFGTRCAGSSTGPNSFTVNGTALTAANVLVGPLPGYTFATNSGGPYSSSLSIAHARELHPGRLRAL